MANKPESAESLAASAEALNNAMKSLQEAVAQIPDQKQDAPGEAAGSKSDALDPKTKLYYERLEQTGQLVDVNEHTDMSKLSPRITHIRHPDGSIERIGYA